MPQPGWDICWGRDPAWSESIPCAPSPFLTVVCPGNWFYLFTGDNQPPRSRHTYAKSCTIPLYLQSAALNKITDIRHRHLLPTGMLSGHTPSIPGTIPRALWLRTYNQLTLAIRSDLGRYIISSVRLFSFLLCTPKSIRYSMFGIYILLNELQVFVCARAHVHYLNSSCVCALTPWICVGGSVFVEQCVCTATDCVVVCVPNSGTGHIWSKPSLPLLQEHRFCFWCHLSSQFLRLVKKGHHTGKAGWRLLEEVVEWGQGRVWEGGTMDSFPLRPTDCWWGGGLRRGY